MNVFDISESINIAINGIDVTAYKVSDSHGNFLAIPALDRSFSEICGQFIDGLWIKEIDYIKQDGKITFLKAYY